MEALGVKPSSQPSALCWVWLKTRNPSMTRVPLLALPEILHMLPHWVLTAIRGKKYYVNFSDKAIRNSEV